LRRFDGRSAVPVQQCGEIFGVAACRRRRATKTGGRYRMARSLLGRLASRKPVEVLLAQAAEEGRHSLRRVLGPVQLTTLGIGCIIGAGIFVLTGHAAHQHAGPGIVLSFVIAGMVSAFAALCYAELASMIPVSGSAYTYAYATLGKLFAWIIAWDLIVEYLFTAATVSVGWSGYFTGLMHDIGVHIPAAWSQAPYTTAADGFGLVPTGAIINLPAAFIIGLTSFVLALGISQSAWFNAAMVAVKVGVVLLVIVFGFAFVDVSNWSPFIPEAVTDPATGTSRFGIPGVITAAGVIFFAYIGFESVSTAAQETVNPQRNMPIGILAALAICTLLYILMCLVITGVVHYTDPGLAEARPIYTIVDAMGPSFTWLKFVVTIGATIGLGSTILVLLYGQSRIFYAVARDGLLPKAFGSVDPKRRTPVVGTAITAIAGGLMGGLFPIGLLGELVSVGTLLAFAMICAGVMYLRIRRPDLPRSFKTPVWWLTAPLGIASCVYLISSLPVATFWRLLVWMAIGLAIYALYAFRHSQYHEAVREVAAAEQ
jgi:APA family basic amino acid/polyamine antiporter